MSNAPIRAVVFDAAGTLVFPARPVGATYAEALERRGIAADGALFERRFPAACRAARGGRPYPGNENEERLFWRDVVARTFDDACPPALFDAVFDELFARFGEPDAWRAAPDAYAALAALRFLGLRLVLLSNADRRMHRVLEGLGLASFFDRVFLSSETGFPKPDARAFATVVRFLKLPSESALYVGDSREEDAAGAVAAGLRACWLTGDTTTLVPGAHRAPTLTAVVELVRAEAVRDHATRDFDRPTRNLIAELRGLPPERSRSSERAMSSVADVADVLRRAREGDPAALKAVAHLARGAIGAEEAGMDARGVLLDAWSKLVPPRLRGKCHPVDLDRDALVVFCVSPVARNELKFAERALIAAVRGLPGCSGVNRVVCRL